MANIYQQVVSNYKVITICRMVSYSQAHMPKEEIL